MDIDVGRNLVQISARILSVMVITLWLRVLGHNFHDPLVEVHIISIYPVCTTPQPALTMTMSETPYY